MPDKPKTFTLKSQAKKISFKLGYDAAYRRVREQVVREELLCRICMAAGHITPGQQVDHIKPLAEGGTHDRSNLQHLCTACHQAKTADEMRRQRGR